MLRWRDRPVRLISDNGLDEIATIASVMLTTRRDSGLFDIYLLPRSRQLFPEMKAIRDGRRLPGVRRARRLVAAPIAATKTPIPVEADGESLGLLPATFEILPQALNLRC
jgi:diacylglycerol kinase family enzyme